MIQNGAKYSGVHENTMVQTLVIEKAEDVSLHHRCKIEEHIA